MTISSISSSSSYINQLATMRTRASSGETQQAAGPKKPDFSKMFSTMDADSSGGLDSTEVQSLAEKISEATGVSVDLSEFLATYDSDGDGSLSEEETLASLEANRPQGPPPGGMMGGGPDESDMVSAADENGDGVISAEEAEGLVGVINNATGSSLTAEDFISTYDEDGDGSFSTDEAVAAMEANRPQGPSSNAENLASASEGIDSVLAEAIDNYLKMASLGMDGQASGDLYSMLESSSSSISNVA